MEGLAAPALERVLSSQTRGAAPHGWKFLGTATSISAAGLLRTTQLAPWKAMASFISERERSPSAAIISAPVVGARLPSTAESMRAALAQSAKPAPALLF